MLVQWMIVGFVITLMIILAAVIIVYRKDVRRSLLREDMYRGALAGYSLDSAARYFRELTAVAPYGVWLKVEDSGTRVRLTDVPGGILCEWVLPKFWPLKQNRKGKPMYVHVFKFSEPQTYVYIVKVTIQEDGVLPATTFDLETGSVLDFLPGSMRPMPPSALVEWGLKISQARKD